MTVNARSDQPRAAWAVIEFLTGRAEMIERARAAGQYPARRSLYDDPALSQALGTDAEALRRIVERAVPRPVTPVYTQLSEILQIRLHRLRHPPQAQTPPSQRNPRCLPLPPLPLHPQGCSRFFFCLIFFF